MKLSASSFCGYQFTDRSRQTLTIYFNTEKTYAAFITKLLKNLNHGKKVLSEVERAKAETEHQSLSSFPPLNTQNSEY